MVQQCQSLHSAYTRGNFEVPNASVVETTYLVFVGTRPNRIVRCEFVNIHPQWDVWTCYQSQFKSLIPGWALIFNIHTKVPLCTSISNKNIRQSTKEDRFSRSILATKSQVTISEIILSLTLDLLQCISAVMFRNYVFINFSGQNYTLV